MPRTLVGVPHRRPAQLQPPHQGQPDGGEHPVRLPTNLVVHEHGRRSILQQQSGD